MTTRATTPEAENPVRFFLVNFSGGNSINLETLQDGVISFIQDLLSERKRLLNENKKLKIFVKENEDYHTKMMTMKEEKVELLKLKGEIYENTIQNLREKVGDKNSKIHRLQDKLVKIVDLLKGTNSSIYDNLNISNSSIFSKSKSRSFLNRESIIKPARSTNGYPNNLKSSKTLRYSVGKTSRPSNHYSYNEQGLLVKNSGPQSRIASSEILLDAYQRKGKRGGNFPEMTSVLQKVIESRLVIKEAKKKSNLSSIYDSGVRAELGEEDDAGRFEQSYRDLLSNYDRYSLMKIIERFKGVKGFSVDK